MPIFEITCLDCGRAGESITLGSDAACACPHCGSLRVEKALSAPSSLTGKTPRDRPGPGDHGCCGSTPSAAGCAGPGSCCGKPFHP